MIFNCMSFRIFSMIFHYCSWNIYGFFVHLTSIFTSKWLFTKIWMDMKRAIYTWKMCPHEHWPPHIIMIPHLCFDILAHVIIPSWLCRGSCMLKWWTKSSRSARVTRCTDSWTSSWRSCWTPLPGKPRTSRSSRPSSMTVRSDSSSLKPTAVFLSSTLGFIWIF